MEPTPQATNLTAVETPRGTFSAKVDPKGRLKVPAAFQEYFKAIGEEKFFVTTVDGRLLYIYPISVWRENERKLDEALSTEQDVEAAESVWFMANSFGGDATLDGEGRMLIPQELRKALGLGDGQVWMIFEKGKIVGYNELEYNKRLDAAKVDLAGKVRLMKLKGFK